MPISSRDLRTLMLRVGADSYIGAALKDIQARPRPEEWLLICPLEGGYAAISVQELARRRSRDERLLDKRCTDLGLAASPTADADGELADAQALLSASDYVVVLRDDEPYGVLVRPAARPPASLLQLLLAQAAAWQPPGGGVLTVDEPTPKTPIPQASFEPVPQRTDRFVNTDFAADATPGQPLAKTEPLQPGQWYVLRVGVGAAEATSIEATATPLPDVVLQHDAEIAVVVFSEAFAVEQSAGVLLVPKDGPASVKTPASAPAALAADDQLLGQRLLFRVRAPEQASRADLRVSMYCNGMLIQSRLVTAVIGAGAPLNQAGSMRLAALDFNLSPSMAQAVLNDIAPHKLSLMVNTNGDGTHAFRLLGTEDQELFANSAVLSPAELNDLIGQTRAALQRVAWGKPEPWAEGLAYRYDPGAGADAIRKNFAVDMITMAVRGALTYNALKNALGQGSIGAKKLRELMRRPGMVQLAAKISANDVVPIAMFYDWTLDTRAATLTICAAFEASLASGRPLIGEPCFLGECPHRDDPAVICPSGFWGFRHDIGMPWPAPYGPEVATRIGYSGKPLLDAALNKEFPALPGHLQRLDGLGFQVQSQAAREQIFTMFQQTQPQVVYFYCHGVLNGTTPTLKVGPPQAYIDTSNFDNLGIAWPNARPLIFINGCHTTALSPSQALSFVRAFVEDVAAAGVVGTEITIFEPLAQPFAETFLPLFAAGVPFGRAIREARLKLLAQRNPLGLVYQPYAYAGLRLVAR